MLALPIREEIRLVREPEKTKGYNCLLRVLNALKGLIIKGRSVL